MPTCSVCSNAELAETVNQLLFEKKSTLQEIADKVGSTKSSVGRHAAKCFLQWRAARVKTRKGSAPGSGRTIVSWPAGPESAFPRGRIFEIVADKRGRIILEDVDILALTPTDDLFVVRYADPRPSESSDPAANVENESPNCPVE
jgi:hypothetical protein